MNPILLLVIFTVCVFGILLIAKSFFHKSTIFTIAIGAIIGANIYNVGAYPIAIGGLVFGFDSIIYTVFALCVLLMFMDYGKHAMKVVLYTALFSLFFTALLAFFGSYSQSGISSGLIWNTLSYLNSIIATFIAVWAMIFAFNWLKKRKVNKYVNITIVMLLCAILNSIVYFGLTFIYSGTLGDTFMLTLAGSYIGKAIATALCLVVVYLDNLWKKHHKKKQLTIVSLEKD